MTVQFFRFLLPLRPRFLQCTSCFFSSPLTFHKGGANHTDCWRVVFLIFSMVGIQFLQVTFKLPEGRSYYYLFLQCFSTAEFNVLYPLLWRMTTCISPLCPSLYLLIIDIILMFNNFYAIGISKKRVARGETVGIIIMHLLTQMLIDHLLRARHYSRQWGSNNG